ncbi:MAG: CZB domain-containing protein [Leptospiraceae bacterium]|nr:CZB domain-containing protein [Leptospiraceae bacterium]
MDNQSEIEQWKYRFNEFLKKYKENNLSSEEVLEKSFEFFLQWKHDIIETSNNLAVSLLKFPQQIQNVVESKDRLLTISDRNASTSQDLASSSEELEANLDRILENTENANRIAERTERNAREIGHNLDRLQNLTKNLNADSIQLKSDNSQMLSEIQNLNHFTGELALSIRDIREISDTTKILAVNALIESAHAGEMGKGFAVVADRVSELSKKTKSIVEDINEKFLTLFEKLKSWSQILLQQIGNVDGNIDNLNHILESIEANSQKLSDTQESFIEIQSVYKDIQLALKEIRNGSDILTKSSIHLSDSSTKIQEESVYINEQLEFISEEIQDVVRSITNQNASWLHEFILARKHDHVLWVRDLEKAIQDQDIHSIPEMDHRKCKLGMWYYSAAIKDPRQEKVHRSMEEPHMRLHSAAKIICEFIKEGNLEAIEREREKLAENYKNIISCFHDYETYLESRILEKLS